MEDRGRSCQSLGSVVEASESTDASVDSRACQLADDVNVTPAGTLGRKKASGLGTAPAAEKIVIAVPHNGMVASVPDCIVLSALLHSRACIA
jgi:hypothetical protein